MFESNNDYNNYTKGFILAVVIIIFVLIIVSGVCSFVSHIAESAVRSIQ